ncbi:hypothetical protein FNT36_04195 [Hymenobacter setariae]|uniref:Uncharacterized protein n=1 Tax=Hymenobacter setariae TaxID=2594794 RepID=A0A558C3F0_9BACT|nr:hypothetical protein [Hymenobacter setariae]TVT43298.1 hypothetical protein FNT36_04195 [Hymenobacter setariae]
MATFTLAVVGYLDTLPKQTGLTFEQVKTTLEQHRELYPTRVQRALAWAESASPGESWQTDTDLRESDQADIYLTRE